MAKLKNFTWAEALTIGVGHCARAEMAFIIASLGIEMGALDKNVFSVIIFTAFILNLLTPLLLKGCAVLINKQIHSVDYSSRK
ncbi:[weak similarity to] Cation/H+ exchanger [methanotrophic bacterial endosymbiont of Bathymodiolus sp.]|nr:[weak similarity to] Cation/H+ exchanger [methanotrophic bacterial endosymbiont of Bathymodiolus sp.]